MNSSVSASTLESHSSRAHGLGALVLGMPLGGDVADGAGQQHVPVEHRDRRAVAHPARHAVDADEAVFLLHDLAVAADQVGKAPRDVEVRTVVRMHEVVVVVDELLRLLGGPEQRRQAAAVRVHHEALVGPALAAVEVLADDLRRVRERLVRRVGLRHQRCAVGDVLDRHDPRFAVGRDAHSDDRGKALAALAAEHDVEFATGRRARPR